MKRLFLAVLFLEACGAEQPAERYGFVARLGRDTVSVESVVRQGNTLTSDEVDRFPLVRQRHTEITLGPDGGIQRLTMDIRTPSEPAEQRERKIVAEVGSDSVHLTKRDGTGVKSYAFATGGNIAMAHLPQMYSLYELYFAAALGRTAALKVDTARLRQFYIDREFDRFPLHSGIVRVMPGGKAEIQHDWLSGTGEATLDSSRHLLHYSGARTTYGVEVDRLSEPPDVKTIGERFAALEAKNGAAKQLSVRDTVRASIGSANVSVDYSRPLARGRQLLGNVIPYDFVWRTGANAATQFTTSAPITLAGLQIAPGTYTLWTIPRENGAVELVVNTQAGQWGTSYTRSRDLGRAPMTTETRATPVAEQFTISIVPTDDGHGTLVMEWGPFRWAAAIVAV
ncbi:MAG: DUF2911 domain-containing protein [Gemmatimonadaceae bacterium]